MENLLAVLAHLPLGFVIAACWLESVSFYKKSESNQPGAITVLFGAAITSAVAFVAGIIIRPPAEDAEATAGLLTWPADAPAWASLLGALSIAVIFAAYALKQIIRSKRALLSNSELDGKDLFKAKKSVNDLQLSYWFALASALLVTLFNFVQSVSLGQLIAFTPISLFTAVLWLEFVSATRADGLNQPAALTTLFGAAGAAGAAFLLAVISTQQPSVEGEILVQSTQPAWRSWGGFLAVAFVSIAYLFKVSARNRPSAMPLARGRTYSFQDKQRMGALGGNMTPASYKIALFFAIPFFLISHTPKDRVDAFIAKFKTGTSDAIADVKGIATGEAGENTTATEDAGSLGSLMAVQPTPQNTPLTQPGTATTPMANGQPTMGGSPMAPSMDMAAVDPNMAATNPGMAAVDPNMAPAETPEMAPETPEMAMNEPEPEPEPAPEPPKPLVLNVASIKPYDKGRFYVSQIAPILRSRCYDCHGSSKKKGGLQLHTPEGIRAGGNGGSSIIAGNPERSQIFVSVSLSDNDPDVMPPKGKPLTAREQSLIKKWILDGAHMNDGEKSSSIAVANNAGGNFTIDKIAAKLSPPNPAIVQALEQTEVQFRGLSANGAFIKVDYSHIPRAQQVTLENLKTIAANVYHLDLTRTRVTDDELQHIATFPNLNKLELARTSVSNEALAHLQALPALESLSVYGTSISDDGLKHLESIKTLKKLYTYESGVTKSGADALQSKLPDLEIVMD